MATKASVLVKPGGVYLYSTCNKGAAAASPLNDSAVRSPLPVISTTSELPLDQPGRSTIS